jgi:mRNA interferase MazF
MVSASTVAPKRGDVVWLDFNPQAGREQAGRRPALIISPVSYNRKTGLALACPVTSKAKGYPFEVEIPSNLPVEGVALVDHLRSIDWRARNARRICELPAEALEEACAKIKALVDPDRD